MIYTSYDNNISGAIAPYSNIIGVNSLQHKERFRTPCRLSSGSGKCILPCLVGFGLRIETGAEGITIIMMIVDIFDIIIQQVRDTRIHLKVDDKQMAYHTRK